MGIVGKLKTYLKVQDKQVPVSLLGVSCPWPSTNTHVTTQLKHPLSAHLTPDSGVWVEKLCPAPKIHTGPGQGQVSHGAEQRQNYGGNSRKRETETHTERYTQRKWLILPGRKNRSRTWWRCGLGSYRVRGRGEQGVLWWPRWEVGVWGRNQGWEAGQTGNAQERAGNNNDKGLITKFICIFIVHLKKRKMFRYDIRAYPESHRECF